MSGQRIQDHYARSGSGATIAARAIAAVRAHGGADSWSKSGVAVDSTNISREIE